MRSLCFVLFFYFLFVCFVLNTMQHFFFAWNWVFLNCIWKWFLPKPKTSVISCHFSRHYLVFTDWTMLPSIFKVLSYLWISQVQVSEISPKRHVILLERPLIQFAFFASSSALQYPRDTKTYHFYFGLLSQINPVRISVSFSKQHSLKQKGNRS